VSPEVAYAAHGQPGARAPLLLSHGFGASGAMWDANVGALAADREVLTWDLPGHGSSTLTAGLSHERCMIEMLALLDVLGAERGAICGMSLGGYLSLLFCARHPERVAALVLVDTGPGFRDDAARAEWNAWVARLAEDLETRDTAALRASPESAVARHLAGGAGLAAAARGILAQRDDEVFRALPAIAAPTLVVVGAQDERFLAAADAMAALIPGARKLVLADAGHAANMDQPALFNEAVRDFLEDV
jgi:pimeloyl-ACP methyl ester carboxylesterase